MCKFGNLQQSVSFLFQNKDKIVAGDSFTYFLEAYHHSNFQGDRIDKKCHLQRGLVVKTDLTVIYFDITTHTKITESSAFSCGQSCGYSQVLTGSRSKSSCYRTGELAFISFLMTVLSGLN